MAVFNNQEICVGEIVRLYPETLKIFAGRNFDLCCEAGLPLEMAARIHNLDLDQLLEQLDEVIDAG